MANTQRGSIVQDWRMRFQLIHWPRIILSGLCQIYVGFTVKGSDLLHKDNAERKQRHQSCIFREAQSIHWWNVSHIIWAYGYWCYWIGLKIDVTTIQSATGHALFPPWPQLCGKPKVKHWRFKKQKTKPHHNRQNLGVLPFMKLQG